jgi:hypothetical protein
MNEKHTISRRKFLTGSMAVLGGIVLAWTHRLLGAPITHAQEPPLTPRAYLPLIFSSNRPLFQRGVVHVRDADATNWNGSGYFYNAVNQDVVNNMVESGLQHLTGQSSWADIWGTLFEPVQAGGYSAGQKIAIKVNLNNGHQCSGHGNVIDALPQPVLALISGMVAAGVRSSDIIVYDASRVVPIYLSDAIWASYSDVTIVGEGGCSGVIAPRFGTDSSLTIRFNDLENNLTDRLLPDVLYDVTYLINMPIIKRHGGDGENPVTLGFKNHYGSLNYVVGPGDEYLHQYIDTDGFEYYRATYSPFVDIYSNPNIQDKTVLILGDGLFGGTRWSSEPIQSWSIFGNDACNSLFFGVDPVATDCVMADLLTAEGLVTSSHTYDYLFCAQEAGLGTCEGTRADPGGDPLRMPYGSGYQDIEYMRMDLGSG